MELAHKLLMKDFSRAAFSTRNLHRTDARHDADSSFQYRGGDE